MKTEVKEIKFFPLEPTERGMVGIGSCLINDNFKLNGIGIYSRPDGSDFRLVFPHIRLPHGLTLPAFFPINRETSGDLKNAFAERIRKIISGQKEVLDNTVYYEPILDE